ncbi:MAG: restriction endonuclease subunit S [Bacteroidetes bacterium]|nr:restriction endonuclease subunit S [Bacteroidota bacterium]
MQTLNKNRKGYKETKVGWIPVDWEVKTISEAFQICNHLRYPISQEERSKIQGDYPYYGPTKIQDYINEYRLNGTYALLGEDGDHFLKWKEQPMTLLVSGKFNVNNHAHVIKGVENLTEWFFYYFNHKPLTPYLTRQGAGRYKLTKDSLKSIPCAIPKVNEQKKIIQLISSWDKAIELNRKLIIQKELQKKWLIKVLLTGKQRLNGCNNDWSFIRFKEIFSPIKEKANGRIFKILSVTKEGIISQSDYFKKEIASEDTSKYLVVRKGNMVMSGLNFWMGSIDVLSKYEEGIVSPAYKVFKIYNQDISIDFMKFFTRSEIMKKALIGSSVQGASIVRRNLDNEILQEWDFYLPNLAEQEQIAKVLQLADKETELLQVKLDSLISQKKGLMQQLLTGKKRLH